MSLPWAPQRQVPVALARTLVESQFPHLAPARVERLGEGWDCSAYRVNEAWVFRFPRRQVAVEGLDRECRLLPLIRPQLPLPVPEPVLVGRPEARFPWPFVGHRMLPGVTACRARLDDEQRRRMAEPLAGFLAALHAVDPATVPGRPRTDLLDKLDLDRRGPKVRSDLQALAARGLIEDPAPWLAILEQTPTGRSGGAPRLVHGDLYARHVLVVAGRPVGVIDWGDAHLGDPAVDLSLACGFLPPEACATFRGRYGPIDDRAWRLARFRALFVAATTAVHALESDADLLEEGLRALRYLAEAAGRDP